MVSPAAEWFVDNFHLIEDQLREIKHDLPENYYYELPKVDTGDLSGLPRVYAIALAILAHTDSRLDTDILKRFVVAFQLQRTLRIGELWAIPISLRVALVEQLRSLAEFLVTVREKRHLADVFADQVLQVAAQAHTRTEVLIDMIEARPEATTEPDRAFMIQLIQRLRDQDPDVWPVLAWIENRLRELGTTSERLTQLDLTEQAESQVTIGNIISSMRMLASIDWRDFVEEVSHVDRVLENDPSESFAKMDFQTRDRYRHVIEDLSKHSKKSEVEVAQMAIDLARANSHSGTVRASHVGFYFIAEGLRFWNGRAATGRHFPPEFLNLFAIFRPQFIFPRWVFRHSQF